MSEAVLDDNKLKVSKMMADWAGDWPRGFIHKILSDGGAPDSTSLKHLARLSSEVGCMKEIVKDLSDSAAALFDSFDQWVRGTVSPKLAEIFRTTLDEPLRYVNTVVTSAAGVIGCMKSASGGQLATPEMTKVIAEYKQVADQGTFEKMVQQVLVAVDGDASQLVHFAGRFVACTSDLIRFLELSAFDLKKIPVRTDMSIVFAALARSAAGLALWRKGVGDAGALPREILDVKVVDQLDAFNEVLKECELGFLSSWSAQIKQCCEVPNGLPFTLSGCQSGGRLETNHAKSGRPTCVSQPVGHP